MRLDRATCECRLCCRDRRFPEGVATNMAGNVQNKLAHHHTVGRLARSAGDATTRRLTGTTGAFDPMAQVGVSVNLLNSIGYFLPPALGGLYGQLVYSYTENIKYAAGVRDSVHLVVEAVARAPMQPQHRRLGILGKHLARDQSSACRSASNLRCGAWSPHRWPIVCKGRANTPSPTLAPSCAGAMRCRRRRARDGAAVGRCRVPCAWAGA